MAFFSSTGLPASDLPRLRRTGLLKTNGVRHSKQHMTEKKMFGSRMGKHGKDFQIGKKFGSKFGLKPKNVKRAADLKGYHHSGISPDLHEFENMMKRATGQSKVRKPNFRKQQIS